MEYQFLRHPLSLPRKGDPWQFEKVIEVLSAIPAPTGISIHQENAMRVMGEQWSVALAVVYKQCFNPRYRIKATKRGIGLVQPLANLLISIFELCKELHAGHGQSESLPYPDASIWFGWIVHEQIQMCLDIPDKPSKNAQVQQIAARTKILEHLEDPPDGHDHHIGLLEYLGWQRASANTDFEKKLWKPYLRSRRQVARHLQNTNEFQSFYIEGGQLKKLIKPPHRKKAAFAGSVPEALSHKGFKS